MSTRILIVDDSDHIREMLKMTLEFKGYLVTAAEDGRGGLQFALAEPYDLILCDIDMPVMNGLEFVRQYRESVSTATPLIMLTAEGNELTGRAMTAGATAIINKPFEPLAMLDEIEKYLLNKPA